MIQIINLLNKREEEKDIKANNDIEEIFLMEFFKFIGCIVHVSRNSFESCVDYNLIQEDSEYDIEFCLDIDRVKYNENDSDNSIVNNKVCRDNNYEIDVLNKCIEYIWNEYDKQNEIQCLADIYAKNNLFYYLYNIGNLKFVQEYYPEYNAEDVKARENACEATLNSFISTYNELKEQGVDKSSEYFQYAIVYMKYKINRIANMIKNGNVFDIDIMLEDVDSIKNKNQNFVRLYFLEGNICKTDIKYWYYVDHCYLTAISKLEEQCVQKKVGSFLFYSIGRFHEKKLHEQDISNNCYGNTYEINNSEYRSLYKKIKYAEQEQNWDAMIGYSNQIIEMLLNGYNIEQVMPKQQIYVYKSFVMLGNAYYQKEIFDLAGRAYKMAISFNDHISIFFDNDKLEKFVYEKKWNDFVGKSEDFKSVFKSCMPIQPVEFKVKNCKSKGDNYIINFN